MRQRGRQQDNGEGSIGSTITDVEKQLGPQQDDGVNSGGNWAKLDPTGGLILKWHAMFVVSCVIAVSVDPLFFYLPVINEDDKCLALDRRLKITAICLRSVFDIIYFANMILGFLCPYIDDDANRKYGRTEIVTDALKIRNRYLKSYFLIDILAILPIPQVLVPIIFSKMRSSKFLDIRKFLNAFVLLQYVPRVLRIYLSWTKLNESSRELARRVWIKAAFNIFLYILASHVLGAFWYFFSIQRETACWHIACENHIGCTPSAFYCGRNLGNYTFLDDACPIQTPNTTLVDFGIFLEALQSGTVSSTNILPKILHTFWWGLRNLSSLGQNLQTSTYFWENCFSVFISIFGLLLFLYFIGTVQTYMQMATEKSEEITKNTKRKELEIQLWLSRNKLHDKMKEQIISCIQYRLKEKKDFDTENPIPHLSDIKLTKEIKRYICLPLLKNVQILKNENDQYQLRLICESLKPLYYNENSYILREGEPLTAMLFITQGSVLCFKTNNGENGEGTVSGAQCIEKGMFYGEELLEWGFNGSPEPQLSNLPISKTVKTLTKVEAFALTADQWKILVSRRSQAASHAASRAKRFAQAALARRHLNEKMNKNSPKMAKENNTSCHALGASRLAVPHIVEKQ